MKGGKRPLGYTIVEVMIVLAVSGVMFLIAANFINGKQARTAFVQGSNELGSQLQATIQDVVNGRFSDVPLNCTTAGGSLMINPGATPNQGANQDCVFLGKLLHFYASGSAQPENYEVFSLADARVNPLTNRIITTIPNPYVAAIPGLTTQSVIPQHIDVIGMSVTDASGTPQNNVFSVGFIEGLGTSTVVGGGVPTYQSGAQTISLVYSPLSILNGAAPGNESTIRGSAAVLPAQSATICVSDGSRKAKVYIGGNNTSSLNVTVKQFGQGVITCP